MRAIDSVSQEASSSMKSACVCSPPSISAEQPAHEPAGAAEVAVGHDVDARRGGQAEVARVVDDRERQALAQLGAVEQVPLDAPDRRHDLRLAIEVGDDDAQPHVVAAAPRR